VLGFKAGAPLCWTMGRETLPLQIAQANPHFFFVFFSGFLLICLFGFWCAFVLVITLFACAPCNSLVTFCYSLSFCCALSPCYSSHLVDICCSLNELFISPCSSSPYYSSLPCIVIALCCLLSPYVSHRCLVLCCLPLLCCHHHCIVITIITPLFVLRSINTTSTPHLIVAHSHIAICLTPYCGDGISCLLYFPLAFNVQIVNSLCIV
jgi:hypothetical protein